MSNLMLFSLFSSLCVCVCVVGDWGVVEMSATNWMLFSGRKTTV